MKNNKNFWMYAVGRFISLIGSGIQMVALPLYILDLTGSGTLMGLFSMLTIVPSLITSPFSGILGDRKNRKYIMILMDCGRGILLCLLSLLVIFKHMNITLLFTAQVFISIMDSMFNSSSGAIMPELVSSENLINANSIKGGMDGASMVVGPLLGGVIYSFGGIKTVFLINAVSFFVCAIFSSLIKYKKNISQKEKMSAKVFVNETSETFTFIKNNKGLMQLLTFSMIVNFLMVPMLQIIFPFALKKSIGFSADKYGYIIGFFTIGIVFGNVALAIYFKKLSNKSLMKTGFISQTIASIIGCTFLCPKLVSTLGGATTKLFTILIISMFLVGFFNAFINTPISTNFQKMVPEHMRSRFFSLQGMLIQAAVPIGSLIYGLLLDRVPYFNIILTVNLLLAVLVAYFIVTACDEAYQPAEAV
ncbi:MAG: MFS transporter [Bacillota bacterium]|nr:MFS transporter [Bacillota bacterium]